MSDRYESDNEFGLSENIWADVFDRDDKELYFAMTFEHNGSHGRHIIAYWDIEDSKTQVRLLKSALSKYHRIEKTKSQKDVYNEYTITDKKTGRISTLDLMKDGDHYVPTVAVNVGSHIAVTLQYPDVEELIDERDHILKHAKIDNVRSEDVIPYHKFVDPLNTEMLVTVTDVQRIINVIEQILNQKPTNDEEFFHKDWKISYKAPCICEKCNQNEVEPIFILGNERSTIEVAFAREEINELLWACKRLLEKYSKDIEKLDRSDTD